MKRQTRNLAMTLAAALCLSVLAGTAGAADTVRSLRGVSVDAPEPKTEAPHNRADGPPIARDYVQQPPLIPHKIDGYEISKNFNKCMDCHSWSRYQEFNATKVSLTHFKDREGGELSNISPRRYFCTQCHIPQSDAKPLVENTFKRAEGLR
jgi:nitrate reductase (cytochrome), electron transfer subunit